jgi:hypothetical protein
MRKLALLSILWFCAPTHAADIEAGAQHVLALSTGDTGTLHIEPGRGFAAFADVIWSPRFSTRAAATFVNPAAILFPANPPPADVDLGTIGLDIYSVTTRVHAGSSRLSGYAGAGGALVVIGNLDDYFGEAIEAEFDPELTFVAEAGVRYRIHPRIVLEIGAAYLPLEARPDVLRADDPRAPLPESVAIDPVILSAGAAWRF